MRKISSLAVIISVIISIIFFVGCKANYGVAWKEDVPKATFTERNIYANAERSCFCIIDKNDIEKMLDAAKRKDAVYLDNMLADGRAFAVREITKVQCSDSEIRPGIVLVKILEGEFKGQYAYTFSKRVR